ncbi:bis(5'-nucleosyl)-tetraphosphatase [asymmetrical]-like [Watersipora subatra]|uniref:bis(5'-nucleosyl)-tetraphosphatase [asymmetrical]-like n=1 Tax=Watersipora subatra TaxID=2589382 RepID=UPI00355BFE1A
MDVPKVAAGFIIFRRMPSCIEYLMLKVSYGTHWTPPKGHVDPGEDVFTTARRETEEEAGLKSCHYKVYDGFEEKLQYMVKGRPKIVHYWLAELLDVNTPIILSDEHVSFNWGNLEETKRLSGRADMASGLDKAESFLQNTL